ncbi:hypothetical protein ADK67_18490 [Saccharothrix sp. NRRL B-16348]|uniref:hypothetical protein n=1 Tax=Saccharothrix sp. NRRL B-16348 TaxID=1415542 RepID=UPI0006AEA1DE|nr:hypothetical protein [Saccharothrix sp. NRRL B-16348]KOX24555.1 hypothetical protein ADK67_18490 [Saccharothrix sp. NRRL B-16348]
MTSPADRDAPDKGSGQPDAVQRVGEALANVTVLTGLLVYFGWRRSDVQARELGIDSSVLGMSTTDYVLRSVGPVFLLLAVVVGIALVCRWLEPRVRAASDRPGSRARALSVVLSLAWLILPAVTVALGLLFPVTSFYAFPLAVGGGILLSLYASRLRRPDEHPTWTRVLVFAVVSLSLFWSAGNYAEVRGVELARAYAEDVRGQTAVVVYARERLHITAPGACEEPLPADGSRYRFRYLGLRLLTKVGAKYFLVSDGWTRDRGTVVVLADNDDIRVELGHGEQPRPPTCPAATGPGR